ncbi:LOW QUALITY PROTEIN: basic proline-rich protein-like [Hippopotamus amphibius kiboko]|uniref:LOW QUALITY PROTEIN: basic proline-rich protein-like n=1 Tax=Hippopotamus amphibius kiboko TaxID=575201 RepID=UPI0025927372|nr:LOW QUALITY PROTEIN: basic proline-rich protein-like [Hippopotamus amphibius kiboko]
MATLRALGTPRPDGPDRRARPRHPWEPALGAHPKLFISSHRCSGRAGRPRLRPGPGERSLVPVPGRRGGTPREATSPRAPSATATATAGTVFAKRGGRPRGGRRGPQQRASEATAEARVGQGAMGAEEGRRETPGVAGGRGRAPDTLAGVSRDLPDSRRPPLPFVQRGRAWPWASSGPSPRSPAPPAADRSLLCPPPRAREMGPPPPAVGPRGRAGHPSPSVLPCRGPGAGFGEAGGPHPAPPLPVPYIEERHPLPGASRPKGGPQFALSSPSTPPPKWGTAGRCIAAGPPEGEKARPGGVHARLDRMGGRSGWGRGGSAPQGSLRPWGGGLPPAKHFPLSRSENTKPGATEGPLTPATRPPPCLHPGMAIWVGGLGGGVWCFRVTRPKRRDPSRPIPEPQLASCSAWRWGVLTPAPGPGSKPWPWAGPPPHLLPAWPSPPSPGETPVPPGPGQPPPTLPDTRLSSQTSPRGLADPLDHKEKGPPPHHQDPFPPAPTLAVRRGSRTLGPSVCPQGPSTGWPLGTRAWAALREGRRGGSCSWGIRKLLSREP